MKQLIIAFFSLFLSTYLFAATSTPKIDGLWEARYDASNTPSAHIEITTQPNGELIGIIKEAYPRPGAKNPSPNCIKCKGANKDRPVVGMKVLWGMMPSGNNQWEDGYVLNVETGKTYTGIMTLKDNGNELDLRGYILTPMFGDTATWKRIG